jgi:hypothetical protein
MESLLLPTYSSAQALNSLHHPCSIYRQTCSSLDDLLVVREGGDDDIFPCYFHDPRKYLYASLRKLASSSLCKEMN